MSRDIECKDPLNEFFSNVMEIGVCNNSTLWKCSKQVHCAIFRGINRVSRLLVHKDLGHLVENCVIMGAQLGLRRIVKLREILRDLQHFSDSG